VPPGSRNFAVAVLLSSGGCWPIRKQISGDVRVAAVSAETVESELGGRER